MKRLLTIISLCSLLTACSVELFSRINSNYDLENCPDPRETKIKLELDKKEDIYNAFNYRIEKIIADDDSIAFVSNKYQFIFCRGNNNWTVEKRNYGWFFDKSEPKEDPISNLTNPKFKTIKLGSKNYQYRVLLDPNPFPEFQKQPNKVIFEVQEPQTRQIQRQVLYTLEQVKKQETGIQLGIPYISAAVTYNRRIFWTIRPEQGEGNGGIATIVSYAPETQLIKVIQPPEIQAQQILDLAITGNPDSPTFWMGTQMSGEGNPFLAGMGLVSYQPDIDSLDYRRGKIRYHQIGKTPLVGSIPTKLHLEQDILWIGTGNGICQLKWQQPGDRQSWKCWRFALFAEIPVEGVSLYSTLLNQKPAATIAKKNTSTPIEVLWWSPQYAKTDRGRYEVQYNQGFVAKLIQHGGSTWSEFFQTDDSETPPGWQSPIYWIGSSWHWRGDRFARAFDEVYLNNLAGGPMGIGSLQYNNASLREVHAMRGSLDLIKLSNQDADEEQVTIVRHYSGWVKDSAISPYLTIVPQKLPINLQPNPLEKLAKQFKQYK